MLGATTGSTQPDIRATRPLRVPSARTTPSAGKREARGGSQGDSFSMAPRRRMPIALRIDAKGLPSGAAKSERRKRFGYGIRRERNSRRRRSSNGRLNVRSMWARA
jgi:hypothetical protein